MVAGKLENYLSTSAKVNFLVLININFDKFYIVDGKRGRPALLT